MTLRAADESPLSTCRKKSMRYGHLLLVLWVLLIQSSYREYVYTNHRKTEIKIQIHSLSEKWF